MNQIRARAAVRRKVLANKDIFGLMENGRRRNTKKKNKESMPAKNYGIINKAQSFKVVLRAASDDDPTQEKVIVIPIERTQKVISSGKNKTSAKDQTNADVAVEQPKKDPKPVPITETNNNIVEFQSQTNNVHSENTNRRDISLSSFASVNIPLEESRSKVIQNPERSFPAEVSVFSKSVFETPVEHEFDPLTQTAPKILTFDSVIVPDLQEQTNDTTNLREFNSFNGSNDFITVQNQFGANNQLPTLNFSTVYKEHSEDSTKKNITSETQDSGWSLNTPDLSQQLSTSTDETIESLDSFLSNQDSRTYTQTQSQLVFTTKANFSTFDFTLGTVPSAFCRDNVDKESSLLKLTVEILIQRKQMAARRAYERLFREDQPNSSTHRSSSLSSTQQSSSLGYGSSYTTSDKTFGLFETYLVADSTFKGLESKQRQEPTNDTYISCEKTKMQPTSTFGSFNTRIPVNSTFKTSKSKITQLTKEILVQRKQLAAKRALNRLCRESYKNNMTFLNNSFIH